MKFFALSNDRFINSCSAFNLASISDMSVLCGSRKDKKRLANKNHNNNNLILDLLKLAGLHPPKLSSSKNFDLG